METDCEKCLHQKVCALWRAHERQDASCFSLDGCDYFEAALTPPNEWVSVEERLPEVYLDEEDLVCTDERLLACIKRWLQQPAEG